MKRVAGTSHPIVTIEPVAEPVIVPVPPSTIAIEVPHIAVAVRVAKCASNHLCHHPLNTLRVVSDLKS
ncbi:MAG: hypothetical protein G01um101472_577 [Parcubacteria group bacterium Gr01-1014_72]|nr:MAG: hypothetical protein G01um101472_577 [Parcubacteria group bacterium Gr01-1014_72]